MWCVVALSLRVIVAGDHLRYSHIMQWAKQG